MTPYHYLVYSAPMRVDVQCATQNLTTDTQGPFVFWYADIKSLSYPEFRGKTNPHKTFLVNWTRI